MASARGDADRRQHEQAGRPIGAGQFPSFMAVTPDGKTIYVVSSHPTGTVTPVSVATNTAGPAIKVGTDPIEIAIVPGTQ